MKSEKKTAFLTDKFSLSDRIEEHRGMKMEGRRRLHRHSTKRTAKSSYISSPSSSEEQEIVIKKGPWKPEEDEVLLKHVSKYGPRDWSSLLSKCLLRRTGKSCRLRWVNKLRPHLKNGCKFSAEEERVVIELQAQLGNKWAKISTYLPGRTDNDVKNFWSSRQKRLARLLHNSKNSKSNFTPPALDSDAPAVELSSKAESSTSIDYNALEMNFMNELPPITSSLDLIPVDQKNDVALLEPPSDQQFIGGLDLDFTGAFPRLDDHTAGPIAGDHDDDGRLIMQQPLAGTSFNDQHLDGAANDLLFYPNSLSPDTFFGDLPSDIFDQMERIPSPP